MASQTMERLYLEAREHVTYIQPAEPAQARAARTLRRWEALESMGLVRLRAELDEGWEPIGCDCGDPNCDMNNPDSEAFGSIGEFCLPYVDADGYWQASEEWQTADSVWGHVGYRDVLDWRENAYILDIMSGTIDAFRDAWKDLVRRRTVNKLAK